VKVRDLRSITPKDTVLWIETAEEEYLEAGENEYLSSIYNDRDISIMYPEHYKALSTTGITVHV